MTCAYEGSGIVFDFQRFSLNDGPGIRTLVFFKGCPLRCQWCANPESQSSLLQLWFQKDKCVSCMRCVPLCPLGEEFAASRSVPWRTCADCDMKCVDACLYDARKIVGSRMKAAEVIDTVLRDRIFYENSGGGVTLGGGEVLMQSEFAADILAGCKMQGIHTAIETCGFAPWIAFERMLPHLDLLLFDIKHMDSFAHREGTAAGNELILENAIKAAKVKEMVIRLPLIPGFNDGSDNVERLGRFVRDSLPSVRRIEILPYHTTGASKSRSVGKEYLYDQTSLSGEDSIRAIKNVLLKYVEQVSVGG